MTGPLSIWLAIRDMASVPVTVVTNTKNVGFPAAINQGLRLARGEYLVLLNNDVVVTDGWLDQLIALVNAERSSVVSGPLSVVAEGKPALGEGLMTPPAERPRVAPPCDGNAFTNGGLIRPASGGDAPSDAHPPLAPPSQVSQGGERVCLTGLVFRTAARAVNRLHCLLPTAYCLLRSPLG